ncbi:MAG TPA: glycine oxidase ThiO [Longimicrobium sp.]|nr:glycine oxidase ThiO [Longimicrobium sp.]
MSAARTPDAVVIGGGVIGCAIARRAARGGLFVVVLERGTCGAEASHAAAGMLSPLAEASQPGPFLDLLLAARSLYPPFAAEMRDETGIDVGYSDAGTLFLSLREEDDAELEHRWSWQRAAALCVQRLTADDTRRLEPAVSPAVRFALRFPGDHQVDNRLLGPALATAASRAGAQVRLGADAAALLRDGDRVTGVELADGTRIHAGAVVIAGGSWAGRLRGLPRPLPVEPVHGQLLAIETDPPLFLHVVDSPRCYLVPRASGRVIAGATTERVGYRKAVTPWGVRRLLDGAVEIAPALDHAPLVETWSGLRPGTPDGLPVLGRDPDLPNLLYATGHFRNGILLTPLTGDAIGALLLGEEPGWDLGAYGIERFERGTGSTTPTAGPHAGSAGSAENCPVSPVCSADSQ